MAEIENAKSEILLASYIVESEGFGERVLKALAKKAREGVHVKFIVDGYGSWDWINSGNARSDEELFEIHIFHPLPWTLWKIKMQENLNLEKFIHFFSYINRRNHQKIYIFDRKKVFLGSRNIHQKSIDWRETSLEVQGSVVEEIVEIYNSLWRRSHRKLIHRINKKPFQKQHLSERVYSNHLIFLRRKNQQRTFDRLKNAKECIHITTPYLFPTKKVLSLLYRKAKRGIDVRLLVPNDSDVIFSKWISQVHYHLLIKAGVKIYEYEPKILHAKVAIIDDWALIGSSNFNRRSVYRDIELDYAVANQETVLKLKEQFQQDLSVSMLIKDVGMLSIWKRAFANLLITVIPSWF